MLNVKYKSSLHLNFHFKHSIPALSTSHISWVILTYTVELVTNHAYSSCGCCLSLSSQVGVLERLNHTLTPFPPFYPQLSFNATLTMI